MTTVITKGTVFGSEKSIRLPLQKAFELWAKHYDIHLKRLYRIFQTACYRNSVHWYRDIDFLTFRDYVYESSSKYLSPWS